jgi:hypothetical protein
MHGSHAVVSPPFSKENQLCDELDAVHDNYSSKVSQIPAFLPGQPCIRITDQVRMNDFLTSEFWAQDLEMIAHRLWVMTTPSSANINSLHRQKVKGREIVVSEDPRLHLVWIHDRIFIKPIPTYLMSHAFWDAFLLDGSSTFKVHGQSIRMAALGYLRTYTYLIRHQSDFLIAQQDSLRLVPQTIDWAQFCHFLSDISKVNDVDVSGRYQYGELRLTRLNFYAKFFLRKFYYQQVHGQYGDYFARLYGPILFTVAIASTILNAMQVELAAEQTLDRPSVSLGSLSSWASRISMVGTAFAGLCFLFLWLWIFLDEWIYTLKRRPWSRNTTRFQV